MCDFGGHNTRYRAYIEAKKADKGEGKDTKEADAIAGDDTLEWEGGATLLETQEG